MDAPFVSIESVEPVARGRSSVCISHADLTAPIGSLADRAGSLTSGVIPRKCELSCPGGAARNNLGEGITGLATRLVALLSLVVLAIAGPAHGGERIHPWSGGASRLTPFEADGSRIASLIAGTDVSIECLDATHWRGLGGEQGFDPVVTWAMTPMRWSIERAQAARRASPSHHGHASLQTHSGRRRRSWAPNCVATGKGRRGSSSVNATTGARSFSPSTCSHTSRSTSQVSSTRQRPIAWPCRLTPEWPNASARAERSPAHLHVSTGVTTTEPGAALPGPSCRDGRAFDLFPDLPGWPTPAAYPLNFTQRIGVRRRRREGRSAWRTVAVRGRPTPPQSLLRVSGTARRHPIPRRPIQRHPSRGTSK